MKSRLVKTVVIWGLILWLIGYLLSVALFAFVPVSTIGWIVLPIGLTVTIWALAKRILGRSMTDYFNRNSLDGHSCDTRFSLDR